MHDAPPFQFWIRRSAGDGAVYAIRFDVEDGKGLLRVARPGVLVDPPARESGFEDQLTPAQVRASRFLHVWQNGRKRQGYVLSRLSDEVLRQLPQEDWKTMSVVSEGGFYWLVPRPGQPATEQGRVVEVIDSLSMISMDSRSLDSRSMDSHRNNFRDTIPNDFPSVEVFRPMDAPDPPVNLRSIDLEPESELDTDEQVSDEVTMLAGSEAEISVGSEPDIEIAAFGRTTALVRHLRREKHRDRRRIAQLKSEVERLEKALAESARHETELRTALARYQRRLKARESAFPK